MSSRATLIWSPVARFLSANWPEATSFSPTNRMYFAPVRSAASKDFFTRKLSSPSSVAIWCLRKSRAITAASAFMPAPGAQQKPWDSGPGQQRFLPPAAPIQIDQAQGQIQSRELWARPAFQKGHHSARRREEHSATPDHHA